MPTEAISSKCAVNSENKLYRWFVAVVLILKWQLSISKSDISYYKLNG